MHGVTLIDDVRTNLIKNATGQRLLLQWAAGQITIGNLLDEVNLKSKSRPGVEDVAGTHKVAYLDDLVGNILFQFGVYSVGESEAALPPVNPEKPPVVGDIAIVKSWSGTPSYVKWTGSQWQLDSPINKPDDYAWEWIVKNYRSFEYQAYSTVFSIFSHDEDWSIIDLPLEMYRPFAEQDIIDNNAKAWTRYGSNFIPDWLAKNVPNRMTSQNTGVDGYGNDPPAQDKSGFIKNKPPILHDWHGMNIIDGGDEDSEDFNQENWASHAWGYIVDGGNEYFENLFCYFIDGGNEKFLPFWNNRVYPTLAEIGE
jgi:hypothetical protein